jgi:hypothetical protein
VFKIRFKFELLKNPKWKKTHVKSKATYGASLCRFVTEFEKGTTKKTLGDNETPTCIDCKYLMATLALFDSKLPSGIALTLHSYAHFAYTQEKYHKAKIF